MVHVTYIVGLNGQTCLSPNFEKSSKHCGVGCAINRAGMDVSFLVRHKTFKAYKYALKQFRVENQAYKTYNARCGRSTFKPHQTDRDRVATDHFVVPVRWKVTSSRVMISYKTVI